MPHLHVQAMAPGSGFRARFRASRRLLACVSGFSIENTPTSPGLRRLATGPVPVSPVWHAGPPRAGWQRPGPVPGGGRLWARGFGPRRLGPALLLRAASARREAGRSCDFTPTLAGLRAWSWEGAGGPARTRAGPRSGQPWCLAVREAVPRQAGRQQHEAGELRCAGGTSPAVGALCGCPLGKREGPPAWSHPQGDASWGPGSRRGPGLLPASLQGLVLGLSLPAGGMTPRL